MRTRLLLLGTLLLLAAAVAVVRRGLGFDPYAPARIAALLERPLDPRPGAPRDPRTLAEALFAPPFAERTAEGTRLRLGALLADPTPAQASAACADELLALEAVGPEGPLGVPLWRALLDGPAVEPGADATLRIYGCRHGADAASGPALEDSYTARVALARALHDHARADGRRLTLLGEQSPLKGGVNFEVALVGATQSIEVTIDGRDVPPLRASRPFHAVTPHLEGARASLVQALRARAAADATLGPLVLEGAEAPVPEGVALHLEWFGGRLALSARHGGARVGAHLALDETRREVPVEEVPPAEGAASSAP